MLARSPLLKRPMGNGTKHLSWALAADGWPQGGSLMTRKRPRCTLAAGTSSTPSPQGSWPRGHARAPAALPSGAEGATWEVWTLSPGPQEAMEGSGQGKEP